MLEGKVERTSLCQQNLTFLPECHYSLHKYHHMPQEIYLLDIYVAGLNISFSENDQKSFDHTAKAVTICI